jgi:hypothetical protein
MLPIRLRIPRLVRMLPPVVAPVVFAVAVAVVVASVAAAVVSGAPLRVTLVGVLALVWMAVLPVVGLLLWLR